MNEGFGQKLRRWAGDKVIRKFILFIITILISLGIAAYCLPGLMKNTDNIEALRDYILSFDAIAVPAFVFFQMLQVAVIVMPDALSVAGGYIWDIWRGFLFSWLGIMAGTIVVFYISRYLGFEFVSRYIKPEKMQKMTAGINSTRGFVGLLIICLFPFTPKDLLVHIAGLTPIKPLKFFIIYGISRIPATFFWSYLGSGAQKGDYKQMIITSSVMVLLIAVVLFIKNYYDKHYKIVKNNSKGGEQSKQ